MSWTWTLLRTSRDTKIDASCDTLDNSLVML